MQSCKDIRLVLIAIFILLTGCDDKPPVTDTPNILTTENQRKFAEIEELSRASCLCKLTERKSPSIDDQLKAATKSLRSESMGESSTPLAGSYVCFPELGERACVSTYYLVSATNEASLCDLNQVKRIERAWTLASRAADPFAEEQTKAMLAELSKLKGELKKSIPSSACK